MPNPFQAVLPATITSARLHLRLPTPADASAIFKAAQETHEGLNTFYGGTLTKKGLTLEETKAYLQGCMADFHNRSFIQYGVFDAKTGAFIGMAALHSLDWSIPKARIGYWVRKSREGKGYATEIANILTRLSFSKLKLERLEIRTATINPASATIPQKLGYTLCGMFEKNKRGPNGTLWDIQIFARLHARGLPALPLDYTN